MCLNYALRIQYVGWDMWCVSTMHLVYSMLGGIRDVSPIHLVYNMLCGKCDVSQLCTLYTVCWVGYVMCLNYAFRIQYVVWDMWCVSTMHFVYNMLGGIRDESQLCTSWGLHSSSNWWLSDKCYGKVKWTVSQNIKQRLNILTGKSYMFLYLIEVLNGIKGTLAVRISIDQDTNCHHRFS
jgi:hypothetical protein